MVIEFQYLLNVLQNGTKRAGVTWFKIQEVLRQIENMEFIHLFTGKPRVNYIKFVLEREI